MIDLDYLMRINPNLQHPDEDVNQSRQTHFQLFGHYPPSDPEIKCTHPIHAHFRRQMNGATFDIPFDGGEIISDDSNLAKMFDDRYTEVFDETKDFQKEVEEEEEWEAKRAKGENLIF